MNVMTTAELQAQVAALNLPPLPSVETPLPDQPKADTREISQPDQDGKFKTPVDGAVWMATVHQIPQTPLRGKKPFLPAWQKNASADPAQIRAWSDAYPGCNFGSVAMGKHFVFEADSLAVRERFKSQGHDFTSKLIIESSPGKGHRYYLSAPGVENIGQNKGDDFSVRANGEQCVSPGSIHPITGKQYRVAVNNGALGQPTAEEIQFWKSERIEKAKTGHTGLDDEFPIAEGSRNSALASILGKARQVLAMDKDQLYEYGLSVNRQRCSPPLSESEVRTIANSIGSYAVKDSGTVLLGGVPVGSTAIVAAATEPINWRNNFKSVGELEKGDVRMLIRGFLPEGTTFIGGLPGEGKTLFALSIAKALTTTDEFLGKFFVEEQVPVIYLIPESSSRAFRARCEKFGIPDDPKLFVCRTVSEGATLPLDDASLFEAVRELKPVVILDTFIRFSEAEDENDAAQNKKIVNDIIALRQAGAVAVIGLHHAKKSIREKGMSLNEVLRGTGDIAASADAVYGLLRDHLLYNNGAGPNEIVVSCVKPRDFEPPAPFRIAATRKPESQDGIVVGMKSVIDEYRDFIVTSDTASDKQKGDILDQSVQADPSMTILELEKQTGMTAWAIRRALKNKGWEKPRGGRGSGAWSKATTAPPFSPEPDGSTGAVSSAETGGGRTRKPRRPNVTFETPEKVSPVVN